jgi:hypothetical protein
MPQPTGLGLTMGIESAPMPAGPATNRVTWAAMNDRTYGGSGNTPDPCWCGCCEMTKECC